MRLSLRKAARGSLIPPSSTGNPGPCWLLSAVPPGLISSTDGSHADSKALAVSKAQERGMLGCRVRLVTKALPNEGRGKEDMESTARRLMFHGMVLFLLGLGI